MEVLVVLALLGLVAWRVRRWPLTRCWRCRGRGKFARGRRARRCGWCNGSGYWTRWFAR